MALNERLYVVAYDISDRRRWQRVFNIMKGYGAWLQLSVFQCRLTPRRRVEMAMKLEQAIHHRDDHVLILDLGPADKVELRVESLGKTFRKLERKPHIYNVLGWWRVLPVCWRALLLRGFGGERSGMG